MRQEDIVGSLEVGKLADFIVLDQNLFNISFEEIKVTKVTPTWIHGNQAF
ncbi:amidohydrolase family protein [Pseudoalteromonas sp. Of11M-6]|nr:amidohydrolase family protein [Pseudoalteromonas sp. Of11M-6]